MNINAYFTLAGSPKTGLSPTVSIIQVSDGSVLVTDGEMAELSFGWYTYPFTDSSPGQEYIFAANAGTDTIDDRYPATAAIDESLPLKILINKRAIRNIEGAWYIVVYDDDGTTPILQKALKDKDAGAISDLSAGIMAIEEASSV